MRFIQIKGVQALLAAAVTALVVLPVAIAGARAPRAPVPKRANAAKQIKALQKEVASLGAQVAALAAKSAPAPAPAPAPSPAALPPSGPASGDLSGTYPSPRLRAGSVNGATVADGSLTGADVATASISASNIQEHTLVTHDYGLGSVRAESLGGAVVVVGNGVPVAENQVKEAKVSCPAGSRLLGGGFEWKDNAKLGDTIIATGPDIGQNPNVDWEAVGRVVKGGEANEVRAVALCLQA
jgi:hypothetical protein